MCRKHYVEVKDDDIAERGGSSTLKLPEIGASSSSSAREGNEEIFTYRNSGFFKYVFHCAALVLICH